MDSSCGGMVKAALREKTTAVRRVLVTRRQAQILELAAKDLPDKQIARQLGVSLSHDSHSVRALLQGQRAA